MEKICVKKNIAFANLKARTVKTIRDHKAILGQVNCVNKGVVANYNNLRLTNLLQNEAGFIFFVKLNFFSEEARFSNFLAVLRNNKVDYLIIAAVDLKTSLSYYSTFLDNNTSRGYFLVINTASEEDYYRLMNLVLQTEHDLNKSTVNFFRLLLVRETSFILKFDALNSSLRTLYESKEAKHSILLETLSILNYPTLALIDGTGRVLNELAYVVNSLRTVPRPSLHETN